MLVDVALPLPLEQTFTYRVPSALRRTAEVGGRAVVPFRGRSLTGVIVEEGGPAEQFDGGFKLKDLTRLLDERPALPQSLLRLTRWMARYYVCSWGEALSAALPPGGKDVRPKRAACLRLAASHRTPEAARALKEKVRGAKQKATLEALATFLEEGMETPVRAEVGRRAEAASSTLRSLVSKGFVEQVEREVRRSPFDDDRPAPGPPPEHTLTPDQEAALEAVCEAVRAGRYETALLHGVTGSGKTEVYIAALKEALQQGRSGIVLVPEIALTPQTVRRFRAHFPGEVAVLHSQMSRGERFDAWRSLREGRFRIAVGPRSAVLAPLTDVGLIVVDEEHETSYKQHDPAPRYHARDVAVMRASMEGAACLLGSATPSLESRSNAERGKYRLLRLPERVPTGSGRPATLPDVRILDLTRERKKPGFTGALSVPLQEALRTRLQRGEQTILLQNRRGYAPIVECTDCGFAPNCPHCAVTLTYHKGRRRLRCHYCGHTQALPRRCPSCVDGGGHLAQLGTGTERVEEELAEAFPEARLARMDRDTTRRKGAHAKILRRFRTGAADILLGTQMIAKGLDFGGVTLVGVINADTGLLFPDFRAEEHTFQLLMQVAGRAGRADRPGEVLLQTRNPDHPALQHAAQHDYEGFAQKALADRRALGYPPFGRVVALEFRGPERARAEELAQTWAAALRQRAPDRLDVMGPEPAAVSRIKGQHRFRVLLKVPPSCAPKGVQQLLRAVNEAQGRPPRGYHATIDVDAVGLL